MANETISHSSPSLFDHLATPSTRCAAPLCFLDLWIIIGNGVSELLSCSLTPLFRLLLLGSLGSPDSVIPCIFSRFSLIIARLLHNPRALFHASRRSLGPAARAFHHVHSTEAGLQPQEYRLHCRMFTSGFRANPITLVGAVASFHLLFVTQSTDSASLLVCLSHHLHYCPLRLYLFRGAVAPTTLLRAQVHSRPDLEAEMETMVSWKCLLWSCPKSRWSKQ